MTIDFWTLGIQSTNVLILVVLLQHFFWRPVAAMIEQRRTDAANLIADATAQKMKATDALADIGRTRAGFAEERDKLLASAHEEAEHAHAVRIDQATQEVASLKAAASVSMQAQATAAEAVWGDRSSHLAIDIATRLAARLEGAAVRASFLEWLRIAILALPPSARAEAATDQAPLNAVSATALDASEQANARTIIGTAFGATTRIDFSTDPTLVAGLELRGPHFTVGNSWRTDLTDILADLAHDKRR